MKHLPLALVVSVGLAACSAPMDPDSPFALSDGTAASSSSSQSSTTSVASLLEIGKTFTDKNAGYSLLIPETVTRQIMQCMTGNNEYNTEFTPLTEDFPVIALESGNFTHITVSHEYDDECIRINHDAAWLEKMLKGQTRGIPWLIESRTIANDKQLDAFIKERYGKDCSLGEKYPTLQDGTFDIGIDGMGSPEDGDCFVNYITVMKYSPTLKKLVYWDVGQDYSFRPDDMGSYDLDMVRSFRFE